MPKQKLTVEKIQKALVKLSLQLQSGKKKIRVPWYLVPKEYIFDVAKFGIDPEKVRWTMTIKEGKRHYGVAG